MRVQIHIYVLHKHYVSCAPCVISPSENTTPWFRTEEEDKVMSLLSII